MNPKKVSIVIPAYNEAAHIVECLQSLKNQTYKGATEILVVDNNSSDSTRSLASREGVIVIVEPKQGVIFAREAGTKKATGDFIIQTDADTTFPPEWLAHIMEAFLGDPAVVAVAGSFVFDGGPWWGKYFTGLLFGVTNLIYRTTGRLVYIPGSNTAFRRDVWHGYNMAFDQGGDESALLKQLQSEGTVVFLRDNAVVTSARRLKRGLLYNIFVTFLFYRVIDYSRRGIAGRKHTSADHGEESLETVDQISS